MDFEITLDNLGATSVSVATKNYVTVEDIKYYVGDPHRRSYTNSTSGRTNIASELAEPYLSAVMSVWGASPTVSEFMED